MIKAWWTAHQLEYCVVVNAGAWWCCDDCRNAWISSHTKYTLLRWVWPLTGWWSDYRWIARRR